MWLVQIADVALLLWCNPHGNLIIGHTPVRGCQKRHLRKAFCSLAFPMETKDHSWLSLEAEKFWWILKYT